MIAQRKQGVAYGKERLKGFSKFLRKKKRGKFRFIKEQFDLSSNAIVSLVWESADQPIMTGPIVGQSHQRRRTALNRRAILFGHSRESLGQWNWMKKLQRRKALIVAIGD